MALFSIIFHPEKEKLTKRKKNCKIMNTSDVMAVGSERGREERHENISSVAER